MFLNLDPKDSASKSYFDRNWRFGRRHVEILPVQILFNNNFDRKWRYIHPYFDILPTITPFSPEI